MNITPEIRKVVASDGTFRIVLPKWWCRKHDIEKGEHLEILELRNGDLLIRKGATK